jgi:hypothetical protein
MEKIQIEGRSTLGIDYLKASRLIDRSPQAFMKAQDVLVAAKKFRTNRGWFVSDQKKATVMAAALGALSAQLVEDKFWDPCLGEDQVTKASQVFAYFTCFAEAFPDWDPEYGLLNRTISLIIDGTTPLTWTPPNGPEAHHLR